MNGTIGLQELAEKVERLPSLPTVYLRINELLSNPNSSAAEIGQVVGHDQAIAAKLLSVVNSSFYGFKQRITTVTHAMTLIGFRGLKDLVLALSVLPKMPKISGHGQFHDTSFWAHAVSVAACTRAAAQLLRLPDPESAFTAGLLHDVGKLATYQFMPEEFFKILEQARSENRPMHEVEMENFGFTHADVGHLLAVKWQFPSALTEVICHHHRPALAVKHAREAAIAHLSDIIARARGLALPYDPRVPPLDEHAWEITGIKRTQIPTLMSKAEEEYAKGKAFVDIIRGSDQ